MRGFMQGKKYVGDDAGHLSLKSILESCCAVSFAPPARRGSPDFISEFKVGMVRIGVGKPGPEFYDKPSSKSKCRPLGEHER